MGTTGTMGTTGSVGVGVAPLLVTAPLRPPSCRLHVQVPPVPVVLGVNDPAGGPIGVGRDDLVCL